MKIDQGISIPKKRVAREAIRDLSALAEPEMAKRQLTLWLTGERPFVQRALWLCEEICEASALGSMEGRSLFRVALGALLELNHPLMLRLMVMA